MADPKTVAGGVAVVAIGGGAGYGISQAVDNKKEPSSQSGSSSEPQQPAPASPTVRDQMTKAGFEGNETKDGCKSKLDATYNTSNYKETVKDCVKDKKFEAKATSLGLSLLVADNDKSKFSNKWSNADKKAAIKVLVSELSSETSDTLDDTKQGNVLNKCKSLKDTEISSTNAETTWTNFLKACAKDDGDSKSKFDEALNKDFWTGEVANSEQ